MNFFMGAVAGAAGAVAVADAYPGESPCVRPEPPAAVFFYSNPRRGIFFWKKNVFEIRAMV